MSSIGSKAVPSPLLSGMPRRLLLGNRASGIGNSRKLTFHRLKVGSDLPENLVTCCIARIYDKGGKAKKGSES